MWPCGWQPARLLYPRDIPGKKTGLGCHSPLWGIFLTQGSKPCLLHWKVDSLPMSHQGSPSQEGTNANTWYSFFWFFFYVFAHTYATTSIFILKETTSYYMCYPLPCLFLLNNVSWRVFSYYYKKKKPWLYFFNGSRVIAILLNHLFTDGGLAFLPPSFH